MTDETDRPKDDPAAAAPGAATPEPGPAQAPREAAHEPVADHGPADGSGPPPDEPAPSALPAAVEPAPSPSPAAAGPADGGAASQPESDAQALAALEATARDGAVAPGAPAAPGDAAGPPTLAPGNERYLAPLLEREFDLNRERRGLRRRRGKESRFRAYGIVSLAIAILFLVILLVDIGRGAFSALTQATVTLEIPVDPNELGLTGDWGERELRSANTDAAFYGGLYRLFPDQAMDKEALGDSVWRANRSALKEIIPGLGGEILRERLRENPAAVGGTVVLEVPLSDPYDRLLRGHITRLGGETLEEQVEAEVRERQAAGDLPPVDVPEAERDAIRERLVAAHYALYKLEPQAVRFLDELVARPDSPVSVGFNWRFFANPNQRSPEFAGLLGALVGSILTLAVCMVLTVPIGVAAAVYLEEFAPKNRVSDFIEININNLAAVPSIIFGLLGLAVLIQFFGIPERTPLVGGMVLALLTLPTIIISARAALKAVPPSIREAALGMGASRQQVILHHVLPLALPGILTGAILGLAGALGETAPLIMIGLTSYVTTIPDGILSPSSTLPAQIYSWSSLPEAGLRSKTSLAILVLLLLLMMMNGAAIWARSRFEKRW